MAEKGGTPESLLVYQVHRTTTPKLPSPHYDVLVSYELFEALLTDLAIVTPARY